ncbi:hypothetical protein A33M_0535 [Rhodovulum sp. PH10]|uniref:hypothetical protein n=1 Tax=Rhodovulum sp. PH10 TaxID=1187851 RepID=UPI00027C2ACE|nr:hypothetical protein [Rhodovulum sp. PH10]EJW10077.1 hypothetical protein A33M_0535 [Rhodovulum sp. PH10]
MGKVEHRHRGIGAIAAYGAAIVAVTLVLQEMGAGPFGYTPLTTRLLGPSGPSPEELVRHGKLLLKVDENGNCREYGFDNKTQRLTDKGVVVCDPERAARIEEATASKSKLDSFREAFGKR